MNKKRPGWPSRHPQPRRTTTEQKYNYTKTIRLSSKRAKDFASSIARAEFSGYQALSHWSGSSRIRWQTVASRGRS